jgi:hypothetical protein
VLALNIVGRRCPKLPPLKVDSYVTSRAFKGENHDSNAKVAGAFIAGETLQVPRHAARYLAQLDPTVGSSV